MPNVLRSINRETKNVLAGFFLLRCVGTMRHTRQSISPAAHLHPRTSQLVTCGRALVKPTPFFGTFPSFDQLPPSPPLPRLSLLLWLRGPGTDTTGKPTNQPVVRSPAHAKYHRYSCHTKRTSSWHNQNWLCRGTTKIGCACPSVGQCGVSLFWGPNLFFFSMPLWLPCPVGQGGGGVWLHGFLAHGVFLIACCLLVRGIQLVLLRVGDVESNLGPDRGPCVICGQTPTENARALLRCREGCGRESQLNRAKTMLRGLVKKNCTSEASL
jgi:hypothetical protein